MEPHYRELPTAPTEGMLLKSNRGSYCFELREVELEAVGPDPFLLKVLIVLHLLGRQAGVGFRRQLLERQLPAGLQHRELELLSGREVVQLAAKLFVVFGVHLLEGVAPCVLELLDVLLVLGAQGFRFVDGVCPRRGLFQLRLLQAKSAFWRWSTCSLAKILHDLIYTILP